MNVLLRVLRHPAFLTAIRVIVGGTFLIFGLSKATAQPGEFFYSISQYQMVPEALIPAFAYSMIYVEIIAGGLLVVGLFARWSVIANLLLLTMFEIAIFQTILRGIPLPDCGCSGGLIHIGDTPAQVLLRDLLMSAGLIWMVTQKAYGWTADQFFEKPA